MSMDYEIENVGGIERATFHLAPGVNVLRGRNAAGKTTAFHAIEKAQGGSVELERRDGAEHGSVRAPGVRLTVRKVTKRTGEAELELADVAPLSTLIDPGFKDEAARARARIRALIELLGIRVDDAAVEILAAGDEAAAGWLRTTLREDSIEDLPTAAEKLRHHLHAVARDQEAEAEEAKGRAQAAEERATAACEAVGGPTRIVTTTVEEARTALTDGARAFERLVAQCEARESLERQQQEIRESLGERPTLEAAEAEERAAREREGELHSKRDADLSEVHRLREALAVAEERYRASNAAWRAAGEEIERAAAWRRDVEKRAEQWDRQRALLDETPAGPTREELPALEAEHVGKPSAALEVAQRSAEYRQADHDRIEAEKAAELAEREAKRLRESAHEITDRLGKILASAGAKGLTVVDGRLCSLGPDGHPIDFERRLSEGQRVRIALDMAAHAYCATTRESRVRVGPVVPLSGAWWATLDPENKRDFAELAAERGLFVLTEEPTDGDLRMEPA